MTWPEVKPAEVEYPESDGEPMGETDVHVRLLMGLLASARNRFEGTPDIHIAGNSFVYYEKGKPSSVFCPDFYAVRGVLKRDRNVYKIWEEGKAPEIILELTSASTRRRDLEEKPAIYEGVGVKEYFVFDPNFDPDYGANFDPESEPIDPPLQGFRLVGGKLQPVRPTRRADGTLILRSEVLGLELHARGRWLRWVDPRNGEPLPFPEDVPALLAEIEERAEADRARAEAAEAELARLRRELRDGSQRHPSPPDS